MHIGIAGAGLLGRLLALELSRAGHRVDVFDPAKGPGPKSESGTDAAAWTAAWPKPLLSISQPQLPP